MARVPPAGKPFTAESLRELFAKDVLAANARGKVRGAKKRSATVRLNMPDETELRELARILNGWRSSVYMPEREWLALRKSQDDARTALKELTQALAKIKRENKAFLDAAKSDSAPPIVFNTLERRLAAIDAALGCISRVEKSSFLTEPDPYGASQSHPGILNEKGWKWLADVLPADFVNAIRPANPKIKIGLGHGGPLARFIAAVVPILTGELLSARSVSAELKKRARQLRAENMAIDWAAADVNDQIRARADRLFEKTRDKTPLIDLTRAADHDTITPPRKTDKKPPVRG